MYEDVMRGESIFARVMHQLGREERLAATVRDRKNFLVRELLAEMERQRAGPNSEIRVANIGSGPAREIEEFLLKVRLEKRLHVTLVDQDQGALEFAHERLRRAALPHGDRVEIRCLFVSFKHLLANAELVDEVREQDLIYTAGFFDYLPNPVASVLLTRLVSLLRERGRLLVGNAVDATHVKWVPSFVLDWEMIYRTPDEMRALAEPVAGQCLLDIDFDGSAAWQFLSAQRIGL
jgi:trans-aconitate methyltransferase